MDQLHPLFYTPFSRGEIKPTGWLRQQLLIQARGLAGNLDRVWPDIRDSRWIGGDREGWERVPYWLDGFIPLAWLLDDGDMQRRATAYIDAILNRQQADGWICPCAEDERGRYDVWAVFLICKVLVLYEGFTGDERIEGAVYRTLRQLGKHLNKNLLFNWGQARWFECLIPLFWLYERKGEPWMLDLAFKLRVQGTDWRYEFENWPYEKPEEKGTWNYLTHVVNLAMALKAEGLMARLTGNMQAANARAKEALALLTRDHGTAAFHFSGDECLSGTSPIQGTELCGVVEAMYSYEHLLSVTGDAFWGDMLERLAYNALPATISPDMWTHQYDQQANQVSCTMQPKGHVIYQTNGGESNLFGLEPNFGCCTANFGQGWPKLAMSTMMRTPYGIAVMAIAPSVLTTEVEGKPVTCEIETGYPFRDSYAVIVTAPEEVIFTLTLRIPGFASGATVEGVAATPGELCLLARTWQGTVRIEVALDMQATLMARPQGMACAVRGPLLYALAPKEAWSMREYSRDGVERKHPYCDYEIVPQSDWAFGFAADALAFGQGAIGDMPFSPEGAPVWLEATLAPVEWPFANGVCAPVPTSRVATGPARPMRLIPYGCTNLRMTEMPLLPEEAAK